MKSNKPIDLRKCKKGDKLLSCHGAILTYEHSNGSEHFPHIVTYSDGSAGSRTNDGFVYANVERRLPDDENIVYIFPRQHKTVKLSTVNVIETVDGSPNNLISFAENEQGNKAAERLFKKIAKENGMRDEDAPAAVEDGYHETGTYTVYLTHSS